MANGSIIRNSINRVDNSSAVKICYSATGLILCWGWTNITRSPGINRATVSLPTSQINYRGWTNYQTSRPDLWYSDMEGGTTNSITVLLYNSNTGALADSAVDYFAIGTWKT